VFAEVGDVEYEFIWKLLNIIPMFELAEDTLF